MTLPDRRDRSAAFTLRVIVLAFTLRILPQMPSVNHRFARLPNRDAMTADLNLADEPPAMTAALRS